MENSTKGNYWTVIVFEDNIKNNPQWKEKLIDTHMRFVISPYHDKDTWTDLDKEKHPDRNIEVGKKKTPHYHVMFHCDSNTTFKTMKEITESLGLPIPFVVRSPYGLYRYFCHQDNPEKHQYDMHDIRHFNGSDPSDYLMEMSKQDKSNMLQELMNFMRGKLFIKMADFLIEVPNHFNDPRYLYIAQTNMFFFKEILKDNLSDTRASIMSEARKYAD